VALVGAIASAGLWVLGGPPQNPLRMTSAVDPVAGAAELIRIAASASALYLLCIGLLAMWARAVGSIRLARLSRAAAPNWLRKAAVGLTGAGVLAAVAPIPVVRSGPDRDNSSPVAEVLAPAGSKITSSTAPLSSTTATSTTALAETTRSPLAPDPPTASEPASTVRHIVVEHGDHLWGMAAAEMQRVRGQRPSESDVADYWRAVVETNRSRLVDPDNPDLIFRGQVIELPPIEPIDR
jgi:hypothetical protein